MTQNEKTHHIIAWIGKKSDLKNILKINRDRFIDSNINKHNRKKIINFIASLTFCAIKIDELSSEDMEQIKRIHNDLNDMEEKIKGKRWILTLHWSKTDDDLNNILCDININICNDFLYYITVRNNS